MAKFRPKNGTSFGVRYEITAADAVVDTVTFDFRVGTSFFRYPLAAVVQFVDSSGVVQTPAGLTITYPYDGGVTVAATALTAGQFIHLIAQPRSSVIL
jgi:hypothetical protein